MKTDRFYVYEFIRVDNREPFYVGKGCGDRYKDTHRGRNKWFKNILNKHEVVSRIIVDNLTESEAYEAEVWFIYEYKHIFNYNLVNQDDGGQGALSGEKNPMFGLKGDKSPHYRKKRSDDFKKSVSERMKGKKKTPEHINNLKKSIQELRGGFKGEFNPNYGNGDKIKGGKNPSALKIKLTNSDGSFIIFETKQQACRELSISQYLLNSLLGKVINVESDFSRMKYKYVHLDGSMIEEYIESATTIQ